MHVNLNHTFYNGIAREMSTFQKLLFFPYSKNSVLRNQPLGSMLACHLQNFWLARAPLWKDANQFSKSFFKRNAKNMMWPDFLAKSLCWCLIRMHILLTLIILGDNSSVDSFLLCLIFSFIHLIFWNPSFKNVLYCSALTTRDSPPNISCRDLGRFV